MSHRALRKRASGAWAACVFDALAMLGVAAAAAIGLHGFLPAAPSLVHLELPDGYAGEVSFVIAKEDLSSRRIDVGDIRGNYLYTFDLVPGRELRVASIHELRCALDSGTLITDYSSKRNGKPRVDELEPVSPDARKLVLRITPPFALDMASPPFRTLELRDAFVEQTPGSSRQEDTYGTFFVASTPFVTADDVVGLTCESGQTMITLGTRGKHAFEEHSRALANAAPRGRIAVYVDSKLTMAPFVKTAITGGKLPLSHLPCKAPSPR